LTPFVHSTPAVRFSAQQSESGTTSQTTPAVRFIAQSESGTTSQTTQKSVRLFCAVSGTHPVSLLQPLPFPRAHCYERTVRTPALMYIHTRTHVLSFKSLSASTIAQTRNFRTKFETYRTDAMHILTCVHMYTRAMYAHSNSYVGTNTPTRTYVRSPLNCTHVQTYACPQMHTRTSTVMHKHKFMHAQTHAHTHTHTHTHKHTHTHTPTSSLTQSRRAHAPWRGAAVRGCACG